MSEMVKNNPSLRVADENTVYAVLASFLNEVIPLKNIDLVVIRGQQNRIAMPKPPLVVMQFIRQDVLSLNETRYTDTHKIIHNVKEVEVQLDFYGTDTVPAQKMSDLFMMAFNDGWASEFFAGHTDAIHPLYANQARNSPFIDGESTYSDRYTVFAYLDLQPELGLCQDSFTEIKIRIHSV